MISKRKLIFAAIPIVAFVAALLALREPDPQAVVHRAQVKLASEKTMRVALTAYVAGAPESRDSTLIDSATGIDIAITADLDRTDPSKPASVSTFEFKQQLPGHEARLAGETRRKDGAYYLHLDAAEGLGGGMSEKLLGSWAKSERPLTELLIPPNEAALAEHPVDAAGIEALRQAVGKIDLLRVDKKLPAEKIDGQDSYHYIVETDMQVTSALMLKLRELRSPAPLTSEDILAVTAEIVSWGKPYGEVWIGKRDGRLLKLAMQTSLTSPDGSVSGGAIVQAEFSRYGQPVSVAAPQAKDIGTLLGPEFNMRLSLAGGRDLSAPTNSATGPAAGSPTGLPSAPGSAASEKDSDGDGLSDGQEAFYGSDPWNPDTDGDGWSDGLEVDKAMNPVGPGTLYGFGL